MQGRGIFSHKFEMHQHNLLPQGFICPMCMASLPGPAELQSHFEKVHNEMGGESVDGVEQIPEVSSSLNSSLISALYFERGAIE